MTQLLTYDLWLDFIGEWLNTYDFDSFISYYIHIQPVYIYNLWLFNIAMENGPFIDGLPIKHGDFPRLC